MRLASGPGPKTSPTSFVATLASKTMQSSATVAQPPGTMCSHVSLVLCAFVDEGEGPQALAEVALLEIVGSPDSNISVTFGVEIVDQQGDGEADNA